MISVELAIAKLTGHEAAIAGLAADVDGDAARWRPAPDAWSMVEVICHLLDEEREDFRVRLDLTLHHPEQEWPPIDPRGWVTARAYQERSIAEMLPAWRAERQRSIAWLRGLASPDLSTARRDGDFVMAAGDLLAAWVAHDVLHMRQLVELRYGLVRELAAPYAVDYAGDW